MKIERACKGKCSEISFFEIYVIKNKICVIILVLRFNNIIYK